MNSNPDPEKLNLTNIFFKDYGKKIIAIIIAILLWLITNLEFDIEKNFYVPVKYTNLPTGLVITNKPPDRVNLAVKGPRYDVFSLRNLVPPISYDLSGFSLGISEIKVETQNFNLPRKLTAISTSPSEISIEIDKVHTKIMNINPILGKPDKGYFIEGHPNISPNKVKVKGPSKLVKKYDMIDTSPVSLEGERSNFTIEVPLENPNSLLNIQGENLVKITLNIKEQNLTKEFTNLNIAFKNFEEISYKTESQNTVTLVFEGTYSHINKLKSEDISVYVDAKDLKNTNQGTHRLKVKVDYPNSESLNLNSISPKIVKININ